MSQKTSIEWTDLSFNPIRARRVDGKQRIAGHYCEKISPGCANCYSSGWQPRYFMPTFGGKTKFKPVRKSADVVQVSEDVEVVLDRRALLSLLKRRKPARIFWCDMSDLFGEWIPDEWIDLCFAVMALTPQLTHQVLTKRTARMAEYIAMVSEERDMQRWINAGCDLLPERGDIPKLFVTADWPLPNVWLGTSVEDQKFADERREAFRSAPAAVKFVSYEPALEVVDWTGWEFVDQMISGGESGPKARASSPACHRSARDFCITNEVAYFFKQWGSWEPFEQDAQPPFWNGQSGRTVDGHIFPDGLVDGEPVERWWNPDLLENVVYRRVGKKAAGRLLDGREWNEMPKVARAAKATVIA